MDIIRLLLREPVITGAVSICLAIVFGLILSDWAEKRRNREMLRAKELSRVKQSGMRHAPINPVFRLFQWKFAVVCIAVAIFVVPQFKREDVDARTRVVESGDDGLARLEFATPTTQSTSEDGAKAGVVLASETNSSGSEDPTAMFREELRAEWEDLGTSRAGRAVQQLSPRANVAPFPNRP